jgi:hypothetical protein
MVLLFTLVPAAHAQTTGEFCVRAYEDRNENGLYDAGEPLITRGLGANLQNELGVIIGTALIDNSPTGALGRICFSNLAFGQYTLAITSAVYEPIDTNNMTIAITDDNPRVSFDYGAERLIGGVEAIDVEGAEVTEPTETAIARIAVSGIIAGAAMFLTALLGLIIFFLFIRRRAAQRPVPPSVYRNPRATSTGPMQPVPPVADDIDTPTKQ